MLTDNRRLTELTLDSTAVTVWLPAPLEVSVKYATYSENVYISVICTCMTWYCSTCLASLRGEYYKIKFSANDSLDLFLEMGPMGPHLIDGVSTTKLINSS